MFVDGLRRIEREAVSVCRLGAVASDFSVVLLATQGILMPLVLLGPPRLLRSNRSGQERLDDRALLFKLGILFVQFILRSLDVGTVEEIVLVIVLLMPNLGSRKHREEVSRLAAAFQLGGDHANARNAIDLESAALAGKAGGLLV